ncbi:MAG TPA: xanthine dehydrogenase family protein molybdopterin-binding subunit [Candidatus Aquilonibacter sp.]|nr:xanthine dehydrogenase family protein molybdopterin-binding subunit [Candidatus Aquilonibacter sp.]
MLGKSIRRSEDTRLLSGGGRYVSNLHLPNMLHAALLRSPHASARLKGIRTAEARKLPGVVAVWAFSDLADLLKPIPQVAPHPCLRPRTPFPLVKEVVHHEGEPVAILAAETREACRDALRAIEVSYEPIPAVLDAESGLSGPARVHEDLPDNIAAQFGQQTGDFAAAVADCDCVITERFTTGRVSSQAMETRAVVARFEPNASTARLTVWTNTQSPHLTRALMSQQVGLPLHDIRVIAPDIGGGFGPKNRYYPEHTLVPLLAMRLGQPVKWVESRRESFTCSYHGREQIHEATLGLDADGRIRAIHDRILYDQGAYTTIGIVVPHITTVSVPGPYRVPNYQVECIAVYTNKAPSVPYRGAGRPQACFVMERLLDAAAAKLRIDPIEIRRRNLLQPQEFPYNTGLKDVENTQLIFDSGNYPECLQTLLDLIEYSSFEREKSDAALAGRKLGIGVSCFNTKTGRGPYECALVRVDPGGRIVLSTGLSSQGQSHETTLAQVCAQCLEVEPSTIHVQLGDTSVISMSIGVYAARSAVMAGNAVALACASIREKAVKAAAAILRVSPDALEYSGGKIRERAEPHRSLTLGEVAGALTSPALVFPFPADTDPGLESLSFYKSTKTSTTNGVYAVVVEVDSETGHVKILRHALVHDCGILINPAVVEKQLAGGVAQGIGGALFEELHYDRNGRMLNAALESYLLPRATEVPTLKQAHVVTPSPFNPLGVKGTGEGGPIPVAAALATAIENALGISGRIIHMPMTPPRVLSAIRAACDKSNRTEESVEFREAVKAG